MWEAEAKKECGVDLIVNERTQTNVCTARRRSIAAGGEKNEVGSRVGQRWRERKEGEERIRERDQPLELSKSHHVMGQVSEAWRASDP